VSARRWFTALLVVVGLGTPAWGQDTTKIEWKFEKGKSFYQEMTTDTDQHMTVMQMKIDQKQKQTFYFKWTPTNYDEKAKTWTIEQEIIGVKMDIQIGGTPINYDSTKEGAAGAAGSPLSDFFKALVGAKFTLTVGPDMKITKPVEGREEFLKKLGQTNQNMEPLLKQILTDEALKQMADPVLAMVPKEPVKKGQTWKTESKLNMGPIGTYDTTYTYTFEGLDDKNKDLAKIKVDAVMKYTAPAASAGSGLSFKIISADLKADKATGNILFDVKNGRLNSSDMSLELKGKLNIDISGMTSDVELTQTQKTTVKTTEANPIKPAEKPAEKPADKPGEKK
jgi:hypothetical protein